MVSIVRVKSTAPRYALVIAAAFALFAPAIITAQQPGAQKASLDYDFFKTRVEPIYLKKRSPAHARCIACHVKTKHPRGFSLEPLLPGKDFWTEEQSRLNFQMISKLVIPGNPAVSMFPMHPLAPEAGGDAEHPHSGGRQFESQSDPDYQTIVEWINGKKGDGSATP